MDVLAYTLATLINVMLVAIVARRLLGVPVGWPRTIVVSLIMISVGSGLLTWVGRALHLDLGDQSRDGAAMVAVYSLAIAWLLVAQVSVLAILEAFAPTGTVPGPLTLLRSLPARRRRAVRYTKILRIAVAHGLGAYLRPAAAGPDMPASKVARSLREALTDGGVTFIKLGQMLSSRPDLLPEAYVAELSRLQSNVPPSPWPRVRALLEQELGRPVEEVFAEIDETPVAAASVAQVHLARLVGGGEVVVKVQRPDARRQTLADLDIVLRLGAWLDRTTTWGRRLGVRALARGFAHSLEEELDYGVELANMRAVSEGVARAGRPRIRVPMAREELSSARVIVMERMRGVPVSAAGSMLAGFSPAERRAMADDLLGVVLHQVVVTGVFHADLHPGNIFVAEDGKLALLDLGAVGRLDRGARTSIGMLLAAVDRQDSLAATDALIDLLDRGDRLDDRRLERDLGQLILRHGVGASSAGSAALFIDLFRLVMDHGFAVPPQVAAAFRALGALEGSLRLLSPGIDLVAAAREHGRGLVAQSMTPAAAKQTLEAQLATLLPVVQRLPRRLNKITEDIEAGRLTVNVRALADPKDRAFITGLVHQFVMTVLAAGCVIGGIVLLATEHGPRMTDTLALYPFLGYVFLLFGFVLGSRVLVVVFSQHRLTADAVRDD
jgi:ubiquinone biosynthesis protein